MTHDQYLRSASDIARLLIRNIFTKVLAETEVSLESTFKRRRWTIEVCVVLSLPYIFRYAVLKTASASSAAI